MENGKHCILIIDDESDLLDALKAGLEQEGFIVYGAKNGEEGLALALIKKPDLILLDMLMPKKDGLTVLKELREDEWGKTVVVIVMTVLDDLEKVAQVVEAGVDEYIIKSSVSLGAIVEKVKAKLNQV